MSGEVYAGRVHLVHSKPGVGKTLWALLKSKELLDTGSTVMYLDAENGPSMVIPRGRALGIRSFRNFRYNHSLKPSLDPQWIADFLHDVDRMRPNVVFIDSLADFLAGCRLDENSSMDVTLFYSKVLKPLRDRGAAVVILDREPWESRGHARGSKQVRSYRPRNPHGGPKPSENTFLVTAVVTLGERSSSRVKS